jgi:hypothetical protein
MTFSVLPTADGTLENATLVTGFGCPENVRLLRRGATVVSLVFHFWQRKLHPNRTQENATHVTGFGWTQKVTIRVAAISAEMLPRFPVKVTSRYY